MKGSRFTEEQIIGILRRMCAANTASAQPQRVKAQPTPSRPFERLLINRVAILFLLGIAFWITPRQLLTRHRGRSIGIATQQCKIGSGSGCGGLPMAASAYAANFEKNPA
jgi:hypothetical protein